MLKESYDAIPTFAFIKSTIENKQKIDQNMFKGTYLVFRHIFKVVL